MKPKISVEELKEKFRKEALPDSKRVHVVPSQGKWVVKREGAKRASSVKDTQKEAIDAAQNLKSSNTIFIHGKDGTIKRSAISK